MKTFKQHLQENIAKDEVEKLFGKELFGELRNKPEQDTGYEKHLYKMIERYISGSFMDGNFPPDLIKGLKILRDSKIHFPDILKPSSKFVFRGEFITETEYKKLKPKMSEETVKAYNFNTLKNYTFKPRTEIQSFTEDFFTAEEFGDGASSNGHGVGIIYEVKVDDDFIFSSTLLNMFNKAISMPAEYEVMRFSKKPVKAKIYISTDWI